MLAIRLQRAGRKAYPTYKVVVQDAHRHPSSGRVVVYAGSFNPHTKEVKLDKEVIEKYLDNGARPTSRVVRLLQDAKIALPKWVDLPRTDAQKPTRSLDKLRKNRPAEESVEETVEVVETPTEEKVEVPEEKAETETTTEETTAETSEANGKEAE